MQKYADSDTVNKTLGNEDRRRLVAVFLWGKTPALGPDGEDGTVGGRRGAELGNRGAGEVGDNGRGAGEVGRDNGSGAREGEGEE